MHTSIAFSLSILSIALLVSGCGETDSDSASKLAQTWNSPKGETKVLADESPFDFLHELGLDDAEQQAAYRAAFPSLLSGCFATSLMARNADGTASYAFKRTLAAENASCSTYAGKLLQHDDVLIQSLVCDFQDIGNELPLRDTGNSFIQWTRETPVSLEDWMAQHCEPVGESGGHRVPNGAPCSMSQHVPLVCELGLFCKPYALKDAELSSHGRCSAGDTSEALHYAISGPYSHILTANTSVNWPLELHTTLFGPHSESSEWAGYWNTILERAFSLYLQWGDAGDTQITFFRGQVSEHSPFEKPFDGTAVHIRQTGTDAHYLCPLPTFESASFDENGDPEDIEALADSLAASCEATNASSSMLESTICPNVPDSPFICADGLTCQGFSRGWLGVCTRE